MRDEWDEAGDKYFRAETIYARTGDKYHKALMAINRALVEVEKGQLRESEERFRAAILDFQQMGFSHEESGARIRLMTALADMGRLEEALREHETITEILKQFTPDLDLRVDAAILHGRLLFMIGDLATASVELQRAIEDAFHYDLTGRLYTASLFLARVQAAQGNFREARELYAGLVHDTEPVDDPQILYGLATVDLMQGNLETARSRYLKILGLETVEELKIPARQSLAEIALHEGDLERALDLANRVVDRLEDEYPDLLPLRSEAREIRARVLLARGEIDAARKEIERAREYLRSSDLRAYRLPIDITAARIEAAEGRIKTARTILDGAIAEADRRLFRRWTLEARLARGEIELLAGDAAKGKILLDRVRVDADLGGYRLITNRIAQLPPGEHDR